MKHFSTLVIVLTIFLGFSIQAQGQKGLYFKPTAGQFLTVSPGEFPNAGSFEPRQTVLTVVNPLTGATKVVSEKALNGSFGEGLRYGLTVGYKLDKNLALEFGVTYFEGKPQTLVQKTVTAGTATLLELKAESKAVAAEIAPAFVVGFPCNHKIKPYARVGVILPVYGYSEVNTTAKDQIGSVALTVNPLFKSVELARTEKVQPNPTLGFIGGLGIEIPFGDKLGLTAELEYRNTPVSSKSKEMTAFSATGTLASGTKIPVTLDQLPYYAKNVVYQDEITESSNVLGHTGFDTTKAGNELKSYINIGGLGAVIGLRLKF
ncbi:MAG TPA: outer membrane beta-barrel protein [Rhodothermales bacterium]|nr:outer membrane beta-barrel protein [Rhodothermales bacterium]